MRSKLPTFFLHGTKFQLVNISLRKTIGARLLFLFPLQFAIDELVNLGIEIF